MESTNRVSDILADAQAVQNEAIRLLEAGDIRDAAEKAWCATKRATDALILFQTGEEPETSSDTSGGLLALVEGNDSARSLVPRYYSRQSQLHGRCFYLGICQPVNEVERRIRETSLYLSDVAVLTGPLASET